MPRYKVTSRYGGVLDDGTRVTWVRGMEVELAESVAAWVNRDAQGTLAPVAAEVAEPEPVVKAVVDEAPAAEEPAEPAEAAEDAAEETEPEKPTRNRKHTPARTRA